MIAKESIDELKTHIDIVDILSNHLTLKKNGANFKTPCPFHDEKTPSFVVSPAKQIYHCFGCGVTGDAIKFTMEYEHITYPEAIEKLAQYYNFSLTYTKNNNQNYQNIDILNKLNKLYISTLNSNSEVVDYLKDRGVTTSSIEIFEIGYAAESSNTMNYLKKLNIKSQDALNVGAVVEGDRGFYARFIKRLTFPIYNYNSKIIGFGGRTISGHDAKYINSPHTKIFNKSQIFYGLNIAKDNIFKIKEIIITEGYLDVIMLHQAGFKNAVAILGTALTSLHIPILKKLNAKVILSFDSDEAGINATIKSAKLLAISNIDSSIALLESGKDPADMVKNKEIEKLSDTFTNTKKSIEFIIDESIKRFDLSNPIEIREAFNSVKDFLLQLDPIIQKKYLDLLGFKLKIDIKYIDNILKNRVQKNQNSQVLVKDSVDFAELNLIKSSIENPRLIDTLVDTLSENSFIYHLEEYKLLLRGDFQNPKLLEILLRDDITAYSVDEFKIQLLIFQIDYYRSKLRRLSASENIEAEKKLYLIRKYKQYIKKIELIFSKLKNELDV